jgi:hypothetical protein
LIGQAGRRLDASVIVTSTLGGPGRALRRPARGTLLASVDVEWTKNYRVRDGNVPFCYSVIYLAVPAGQPLRVGSLPFEYTSVYVDHTGETQALINAADTELREVLRRADIVVGHQLSSDLATLANASQQPLGSVQDARTAWRDRRSPGHRRAVVDTRYDTGTVLGCRSRRLVDVCTDLGLDVTQPELRGSMTGMHRSWLDSHEDELRERVSVLNVRHSLSAALVALRAIGRAEWAAPLNVNRLLADGLADAFAWLQHPTFARLLR